MSGGISRETVAALRVFTGRSPGADYSALRAGCTLSMPAPSFNISGSDCGAILSGSPATPTPRTFTASSPSIGRKARRQVEREVLALATVLLAGLGNRPRHAFRQRHYGDHRVHPARRRKQARVRHIKTAHAVHR